jgi:hypothetical protein
MMSAQRLRFGRFVAGAHAPNGESSKGGASLLTAWSTRLHGHSRVDRTWRHTQAYAGSATADTLIPPGPWGRGSIEAGQGGGSSSSEPGDLRRHAPKRPRPRNVRGHGEDIRLDGRCRPFEVRPSKDANARRMSERGISVPLSSRRIQGSFSTVFASDAQAASKARFSSSLMRG